MEHLRLWAGTILAFLGLAWSIFWSIRIAQGSAKKAEQDKLAGELATLGGKLTKLQDAITSDERSDSREFVEVKSRLQKVEEDIKHLPTKEQVHNLELTMRDLNGTMQTIRTEIRPLSASVERIDNFLMRQATTL